MISSFMRMWMLVVALSSTIVRVNAFSPNNGGGVGNPSISKSLWVNTIVRRSSSSSHNYHNYNYYDTKNRKRIGIGLFQRNAKEEDDTEDKDDMDEKYMKMALEHATLGYGHSFPNPAVGCVLVDNERGDIIGAGYHPKAGWFHAEAFALLEAYGHVSSGIDAATECRQSSTNNDNVAHLQSLLDTYTQKDGPQQLFQQSQSQPDDDKKKKKKKVTAYVTLEPCCHVGKRTPPCAQTFVSLSNNNDNDGLFAMDRVVIGQVDPNPQVDGGGIQILKDGGIDVTVLSPNHPIAQQCYALTYNFQKRTSTPLPTTTTTIIGGPQKSILRSIAGRWKQEGIMTQIEWGATNVRIDVDVDVETIPLSPTWLEQVDSALWKHELVVLRLNKACQKKKQAKALGQHIANTLTTSSSSGNIVTVVQTLGHTVLLYRPTLPKPKLQLHTPTPSSP